MAVTAFAGSVLAVPGAASAAADPVFGTYAAVQDVVVDTERGHVFVSRGGGELLVTDLSGELRSTVGGFGAAAGLAVTPDGGSLWVADSGGALVRVDLTTLTVAQRIPVAPGLCPGDVAVVGDRLAFGYSCKGYRPAVYSGQVYDPYAPYTGSTRESATYTLPYTADGGLGLVDPTSGTLLGTTTTGPAYRPAVESAGADAVYAVDTVLGSTLTTYSTTNTVPAPLGSTVLPCQPTDLAATPEGSRVATTCGGRADVWTRGPTPVATHLGPAEAGAAWSADGRTLALAGDGSGPDVALHVDGSSTPSRTHELGPHEGVVEYGLAVSPDGSRAWSTGWIAGVGGVVRELSFAAAPSTLTLDAAPTAVPAGGSTVLSGRLTSGGVPVPGARIGVVPSDEVDVPAAVTAADGTWSTVASFPEWVTGASLRAVHVGTPAHQSAAATITVTATGSQPSPGPAPTPTIATTTALTGGAQGVAGRPLTLTGRVGTSTGGVPSAPVSVVRSGCSPATASWSPVTGSDGGFTVTDTPPAGSCRYTASFAGDRAFGPSGASTTVTVAQRTTSLTVSAVRIDRRSVRVNAQLGPTGTNRTVTITARPAAGGPSTTLVAAAVQADGALTITHAARVTTTYTAGFSGDSDSLPATASATA